MQRKYKILLAGINCSMWWMLISLMYFYYVSRAGAMVWLILLLLLAMSIMFLVYTIKVFKNEVTVHRALHIRSNIMSLLIPLIMFFLGSLAIVNVIYQPVDDFFFSILDESDMHFWLFVIRTTLGVSLIQFSALVFAGVQHGTEN
jgi:hypothetical protein